MSIYPEEHTRHLDLEIVVEITIGIYTENKIATSLFLRSLHIIRSTRRNGPLQPRYRSQARSAILEGTYCNTGVTTGVRTSRALT